MIEKLKKWALAMSAAKKVVAIALMLAVLCTITAVAADSASYYVELIDGRNTTIVYTSNTSAEKILKEANVEFSALDKIDTSEFTPGKDSKITLKRACLVGVNDEQGTVYFMFDGTVAQAIEYAEVKVGEHDLINYPADTTVFDGQIISVARAFPVKVADHGKRVNLEMAGGTVEDAIKEAGITLGKDDVVSHKLDEAVSSGMVIYVDEIIYKEVNKTEKIKYSTTTKKDALLPKGSKKVLTNGVDGEKEVVYKEKYVNGVLTDTTVVSETVTKKAVTQVISVGTKKTGSSKATGDAYSALGTVALDSNGVPVNYKDVISGSSTAYTGGTGTASGRKPGVGYVAVDPKKIPYGTKLYIVATDGTVYGYAIAADTGGFIHDGKTVVDVYMATYDDCVQWGRKNVNVYVLG